MTITATRDALSRPVYTPPASEAVAPSTAAPSAPASPTPSSSASIDTVTRDAAPAATGLRSELRYRYIDPHVMTSRPANAVERANLARGLDVEGVPLRSDSVMRIDTARRALGPFERGMITSLEERASDDVRKLAVLAELLGSRSFRSLSERDRIEALAIYGVHLDTLARLQNVPFRTDVVASDTFRALQPWDQGLVHGAMASVMAHRDRLASIRAVIDAPGFRALPVAEQSRVLAGMTSAVETPTRLANQARVAEVLAMPEVRALSARARGFVEGMLAHAAGDRDTLDQVRAILGSPRFRQLDAEGQGALLVRLQGALPDRDALATLHREATRPVRPGIR